LPPLNVGLAFTVVRVTPKDGRFVLTDGLNELLPPDGAGRKPPPPPPPPDEECELLVLPPLLPPRCAWAGKPKNRHNNPFKAMADKNLYFLLMTLIF
jgi:hypothetical protein